MNRGSLNINILIIERHFTVNRNVFCKLAEDKYHIFLPFASAMFSTSTTKLLSDFGRVLHQGKLLHGMVYLDVSRDTAMHNISKRGLPGDDVLEKTSDGNALVLNEMLQPLYWIE